MPPATAAAETRPAVPDLSVVIVNWNTRDVLRECLASVTRAAAGLRAEVIVVDNGSADGSADMVRAEFPAARLIANPDNRGFAAANNQAFAVAAGRYVLLLNSDTVVLGDVLFRSLVYMERNRDVGVLGCRVLNGDGSVQLTCSRFPTLGNLALLASGLFRCRRPALLGRYLITDWRRDSERDVETVTGCYMLVRAEALRQVGPLDEAFFFYGEETDWCKRFVDAGWKLRFAPVGEIIHYGSLSSRKVNSRRDLMLSAGLVRLHRKHGGKARAAAAWVILLGFNVTRAGFWAARSMVSLRGEVKGRRDHFFGVVARFASAWPAAGGVRP